MDMNNNTIFKYLNESERVREGSGEEERKGCRGGDSHHIPISAPLWLVWRTGGSWRMRVGYYKLNQVGTPIATSVPMQYHY